MADNTIWALARHFERGSAEGQERSDLSGWDCPSQPLEVDRLCHERSDLSGRDASSQPLELDRGSRNAVWKQESQPLEAVWLIDRFKWPGGAFPAT